MSVEKIRPRLVLDACQVTRDNVDEVARWAGAEGVWESTAPVPCVWLAPFRTGEEQGGAFVDDWVVAGPAGFFAVKPTEFTARYETVDAR